MWKIKVGTSRDWIPKKATEEAFEQIFSNNSEMNPPNFVILLATIHYKKNNGFEKILKIVTDKFPKGTTIVGGTIAGFISKMGCYSRGIAILSFYSDEANITIGVGYNTKKNPKNAANQVIYNIKKSPLFGKHKNQLMINLISGTTLPSFPLIGQRRIIRTGIPFFEKVIVLLIKFSTNFLQIGFARECEILKQLEQGFPEAHMIGGSLTDDLRNEENYQFVNGKIVTNAIISILIETSKVIKVNSGFGLIPTNIEFNNITTDPKWGIIKTMDGKPATKILLDKLKWPETLLNEKKFFQKSYQYPLVYSIGEEIIVRTIGSIWDNYVGVPNRIESNKVKIYHNSGQTFLKTPRETYEKLKSSPENIKFLFGVECGIHVDAFRSKIFKIKSEVDELFKLQDYLIIWTSGEHVKIPNKILRQGNVSFNLAIIE